MNLDALNMKSYFTEFSGAPSGRQENYKFSILFTPSVKYWAYAQVKVTMMRQSYTIGVLEQEPHFIQKNGNSDYKIIFDL